MFSWNVVNKNFPAKENLRKKKTLEEAKCPICQQEEEFVIHMIWNCPAAVDVWAKGNSPVSKWKSYEGDVMRLWTKIYLRLRKTKVEETVVIMRRIWL